MSSSIITVFQSSSNKSLSLLTTLTFNVLLEPEVVTNTSTYSLSVAETPVNIHSPPDTLATTLLSSVETQLSITVEFNL